MTFVAGLPWRRRRQERGVGHVVKVLGVRSPCTRTRSGTLLFGCCFDLLEEKGCSKNAYKGEKKKQLLFLKYVIEVHDRKMELQ